MSLPKYAQAENERRFWVESLAGVSLDPQHCVRIQDRYINNSQLRLRAVTDADGTVTYKLCKKYPTNDSFSGAIVNVYLSGSEYALLNGLPGKTLTKKRYRVRIGDNSFGVNVFDGPLAGLVLCEAEQPSREQIIALQFPAWATTDVTEDQFFSGGQLAQITPAQLETRLKTLRG